jgi:peroxiredoxin
MAELGQLESHAGEFEKRNVRIVAVSLDDLEDSKATQEKFPHLLIIADHEKKLSEALQVIHGTEGPGGAVTNAPTTILVDGQGVVRWVYRPDRFLTRLSAGELLQAVDQNIQQR